MALVQGDGPGSLQSEATHSDYKSSRSGARQPPALAAPTPARISRRRGTPSSARRRRTSPSPRSETSTPALKNRKPLKGTVISPRAHGLVHAINTTTNSPVEIRYHLHIIPALQRLFQVHLLPFPPDLFTLPPNFGTDGIHSLIARFRPPVAEIWSSVSRGAVSVTVIPTDNQQSVQHQCNTKEHRSPPHAQLPFPLRFFIRGRNTYLVQDVESMQRCEYCARFYKHQHECTARRRDFYFHHVSAQSSQWWKQIQFFPIGSLPDVQRLFVTYDVETYTWMGSFGKQLVPFMLVMKFTGEAHLVNIAVSLALQLQWNAWHGDPYTFYLITPEKMAIGKQFRAFRDHLQTALCEHLWINFVQQNPQLQSWCQESFGLRNPEELTYEQLVTAPDLRGTPKFFELYIVGHNINGFDEIVLAAQVINNRTAVPAPFRISRNFIPRAGKILFNDVTLSLPNPKYRQRKDFTLWQRGTCDETDFKNQFLKVMVRDTFQLTHTSLRKAAEAYSLPVEKGCCPYKAVNEFYMLGSYRATADGFPLQEYWKDESEYLLNLELWKSKKLSSYNLIHETLEYCALDVLVTAALVEKLFLSYSQFIRETVGYAESSFNVFQRPTISSNSHAIFRQILYTANEPKKAHLGPNFLAPSHELYDYVRNSIRGGRCYPTYIGILNEPLYVYDICGMYASALTHPMPWGPPLNPFERALAAHKWQQTLNNFQKISYFDSSLLPGIFTIDADPPDETLLDVLPPFCSKKGGRLCWTNERLRGEVATSIDIVTLHNRGWKVRLIPDERTTVFPEWKCVARDYVQLNIAAKEKADKEKNQTLRSIAKLLSNALYGSFATKLDTKKVVFSDQLDDKTLRGIANGQINIKSSSFIETDNLSAEVLPSFQRLYSPKDLALVDSEPEESDDEKYNAPFYNPPKDPHDHVTYTYKPIIFLDAEETDLCLHTLQNTDPLIDNDRYPSQIASFVLAWTRAFVSEWSEFLYEEDRGTPLCQRPLKSVYGDTDSLFVTNLGHRLMETKGRKRIKKNGGKLVFDPSEPELTWLVECETVCEKCGGDAYAPESVFLAPKLYALKCLYCPSCNHFSKGKLRAKGHAAESLHYELMVQCYLTDYQGGNERFSTSRLSFKRTLASAQPGAHPFTVTETTLTRTLRPWKDMTLTPLDAHRLVPYSNSRPNPRNQEVSWIEVP
ncbi:DNA polymerase [Simian adenovirus DM-2014]|uniref:DNA polymerase n=1 Tax=Simian adenovirus DM-2014 TaxID=1560346 RepID=A0A097IWA8_9ADEN|nr:DNA polymerase [Simian adenovirus DM-2014]AIT70973.1 DNA polymerase [Simian adenovirus DM-2014]